MCTISNLLFVIALQSSYFFVSNGLATNLKALSYLYLKTVGVFSNCITIALVIIFLLHNYFGLDILFADFTIFIIYINVVFFVFEAFQSQMKSIYKNSIQGHPNFEDRKATTTKIIVKPNQGLIFTSQTLKIKFKYFCLSWNLGKLSKNLQMIKSFLSTMIIAIFGTYYCFFGIIAFRSFDTSGKILFALLFHPLGMLFAL